MAKKYININAVSSKMQRGHSLPDSLDVLSLHELPLFAAACHSTEEDVEMSAFLQNSLAGRDDFLPTATPQATAESPLTPPSEPPKLALSEPAAAAGPTEEGSFSSPFRDHDEVTPGDTGSAAAPAQAVGGRRKRKTPDRDHAVRHEAAPLPGPVTAARLKDAIIGWSNIPDTRRRDLLTAIRHAEHILSVSRDKLQGAEPWSCLGLNRVLWARAPRCYGLSKDIHRNVVSGLRYIFCRLGLHADGGYGRNRLGPAWQALYEKLPTVERQRGLVLFLRFLTLSGVEPEAATPDVIDRFEAWCGSEILEKDPGGMGRRAAGNWSFAQKHVPGWPQVEIIRTGMRDHYGIPFDRFPAPFQAEVEGFLAGLSVDPLAGPDGGNPFRRLAAQARERAANAAVPHKAAANTKPQSPRSGRRALLLRDNQHENARQSG